MIVGNEKENISQADTSSTSICENCPRVNISTSGSIINNINSSSSSNGYDAGVLYHCIAKVENLEKEVENLKKNQKSQEDYYISGKKLNDIIRAALMLLCLIVPCVQLICCTGVVYSLGIQKSLPGILSWFLGGLSFLSIIEVIIASMKFFSITNKLSELEKRLNSYSKEQ